MAHAIGHSHDPAWPPARPASTPASHAALPPSGTCRQLTELSIPRPAPAIFRPQRWGCCGAADPPPKPKQGSWGWVPGSTLQPHTQALAPAPGVRSSGHWEDQAAGGVQSFFLPEIIPRGMGSPRVFLPARLESSSLLQPGRMFPGRKQPHGGHTIPAGVQGHFLTPRRSWFFLPVLPTHTKLRFPAPQYWLKAGASNPHPVQHCTP